jgi:glyoxylase I family protein
MERVTGIGGVFFRARDPAALKRWYEEYLGVTTTPGNYDDPPWRQQEGPTVFEPFPDDTTYFDRPAQAWMINFRVRDLDAMVAQLRGRSLEVTVDPTTYPNGRFARLHDPEGNPIELWEPRDPHAPATAG